MPVVETTPRSHPLHRLPPRDPFLFRGTSPLIGTISLNQRPPRRPFLASTTGGHRRVMRWISLCVTTPPTWRTRHPPPLPRASSLQSLHGIMVLSTALALHPCLLPTASRLLALRTPLRHEHVATIFALRARAYSTCPLMRICPQLPMPRKSSRSSLASRRNGSAQLGPALPVLARTRLGFSRVPCSRTRPARTSFLLPLSERPPFYYRSSTV